MNKDNAKDYLPLVQALAEGRTIQEKWTTTRQAWRDYDGCGAGGDVLPLDEIPLVDLRIKPEPRRAWVWWPPVEKEHEPGKKVIVYRNELQAKEVVEWYGGHVTEVTE